ncbi:hypothetical protein [Methanotorris igneus]|uniref:Uncharacterized protein n=1 Tax=Methanotorris igneus (strain DSM 5666 / JCM 11834 / Kol 5) TaxID=880724 RepID=F6BEP2_METIK|nr:hypothetical protein [Methanotorris igneus]AEF96839.1 hypothetical protein Metig_1302 [Methanotorris igneus Kol 5]
MIKIKYLLILLLLSIGVSQSAYADVTKISYYNMSVNVDSNPSHVVNTITIQNLVKYPLVLGIGELRLQKQTPKKLWIIPIPFTESKEPIKVKNLKGYYYYGGTKTDMDTKVKYFDNYTVIYYEIWEPIDPKGNITLVIEYDAEDIVDNGLLFKTVSIPVGCDMEIDNFNINFKSSEYKTYQNPADKNMHIPKNTLFMINAEFSILPFPELPTYGYVLFWLTILTILVLIFAYYEIKGMGGSKKGDK